MGVMIPCLCTLYSSANYLFCAQTLGASSYYLEHCSSSYHNIYLLLVSYFVFIWLLVSFVQASWLMCILILVIFLQFLILDIFWIPPSILHWICVFDSNHNMRNAHLMEELYYIGLLNFSPISAIGVNGGEVLRV